MVYFVLGFVVGGCAGVILMGLIFSRRSEENE